MSRHIGSVVVVVTAVAALGAACGGSGESVDPEIESAITSHLTAPDVQFDAGLNARGGIVLVDDSVSSYFSPGQKAFSNVEVSAVALGEEAAAAADELGVTPEGPGAATATISFTMTGGGVPSGETVDCEGGVMLSENDGRWSPGLFVIHSCV